MMFMSAVFNKVVTVAFLLGVFGVGILSAGPRPGPQSVDKVDSGAVLKACFNEPVTVTEKEYVYKEKKYKISTITRMAGGTVGGYMFDSAQFAPSVEGYGGPFNLLVVVDETGMLLDYAVKVHHETPKYLKKVLVRKKEMLGKNIFTGATGFTGDAVTGATYTSKGLTDVLNMSGRLCAVVLKKAEAGDTVGEKKDGGPVPGKARNIDAKAYKQKIDDKQLSAQPALYWQPAE